MVQGNHTSEGANPQTMAYCANEDIRIKPESLMRRSFSDANI
jgi:hypothetical protein